MDPKKPVILHHNSVTIDVIKRAEKIGEPGSIAWEKFPDGWPRIMINGVAEKLRGRDVIFIASFHSPKVIFEQVAVIYALPKYFVRSLQVVFETFPEEKSDEYGGLIYAADIAYQMLSKTPTTRSGPVEFCRPTGDKLMLKSFNPRATLNFTQAPGFPIAYAKSKRSNSIYFHHPLREKTMGKLAREFGADIGKIYWHPNGIWSEPGIRDIKQVKGRDVVYFASFTPESFFEEMGVIYCLAGHQVNSLKIILPYYPVGTMERVSVEGEVATAKTMARILSAAPELPNKNPIELVVYDIHALQGRFYFDDNILPDLRSAVPLLLKKLKQMKKKNIAIVFPDDGAAKRYGKMFPEKYLKIICNKVRLPDGTKIVTIKEGDPAGMYCIIVDDLIMTGGTLLECREALLKAKAQAVSVFAPHGVFPEESWERFVSGLFDIVWITDSCSTVYQLPKNKKPIEVLNLNLLIKEALNK